MLLGLLSLFPAGTVAVWNPRTSANYSSYHPPHFRLICEIYRLDTFNPLCVFIHSIKFLISIITSPFLILYNATNKDRIVTIIMIHCSFMFDSLLLYSAASFNSFRILSICTFVSLILLDIPSRLLDDTEPFL